MGQYWKIANLDKKEILCAHDFDQGLKFLEWAPGGRMTYVLATLLAAPESMGSGGGDADRCEWTGRWAGDRIVVVGDYAEGPHEAVYGDESYTQIVPRISFARTGL